MQIINSDKNEFSKFNNFRLESKPSWFGRNFRLQGKTDNGDEVDVRIRKKIHFWTNLFGDKWKKIEPENGKSFYIKENDLQKIGLINPKDPSASEVRSKKILKAAAPFFYKENKLLDKIGEKWSYVDLQSIIFRRKIILALQKEQLEIKDENKKMEVQTKDYSNMGNIDVLIVRNSDNSFSRYLLNSGLNTTNPSLFLLSINEHIDLDTGQIMKFTEEKPQQDSNWKNIDRLTDTQNRQYYRNVGLHGKNKGTL